MTAPTWTLWAGGISVLLILLGVLLRRPPGGWAVLAAALAAFAALLGPAVVRVERRPWDVLVLREPGGKGGAPAFPGEGVLRRRVLPAPRRTRRVQAHPAGAPPGREGPLSWTSLAALAASFCPEDRQGAFILETSACPEGLSDGPELPPGRPAWTRLVRRGAGRREGAAPEPRVRAWIPRHPRQGRPWAFLVRTGPWSPASPLELSYRIRSAASGSGAGKGGRLALRADGEGRAFARVEGPPLKGGPAFLEVTCRGKGKRAARILPLRVLPPPAVVLPSPAGALGSLLGAQGFRILPWKGEGPLPSKGEVLAWDRKAPPQAGGKVVEAFLGMGRGLLAVGPGLAGLAALPEVAPLLPLRPLPERKAPPRRKEGQEKKNRGGKKPPSPGPAPKPPPPAPPPPEKPKEPPKKKLARTVSLLLVLDVSGSMASLLGTVRAACAATARAMDPGDRMGVVAFSDRAVLVVPMGPAGRQARLLFRLNRLGASGATLIWPALETALKVLEKERSAVKAVLVFTDGMVNWGSGWGGSGRTLRMPVTVAEAAEEFRKRGISVSSVVYGGGFSDDCVEVDFRFQGVRILDTLGRLTGGHVYPVKDPSRVVRAFLAEASRLSPGKARRKAPFGGKTPYRKGPPRPPRTGPEPSRTAKAGEARKKRPPAPKERKPLPPRKYPVFRNGGGWIVAGLPGKLPDLAGLQPALADPQLSWVPLTAGEERLPLLATAPPVLARTAAWTSDAGEQWAASWVKAGILGGLLGRLVTSLLPPGRPDSLPEARWEPGGRRVVLALPRPPGGWPRRGRLLPWAGGGKKGGEPLTLEWRDPETVLFRPGAAWRGGPALLSLGLPQGVFPFLLPPGRGAVRECFSLLGRKLRALPESAPPLPGMRERKESARPHLALAAAFFLFLGILALARKRRGWGAGRG